jgi:hypothetical protein
VEPRTRNGWEKGSDLTGHGAGRTFYYGITAKREIKRRILAWRMGGISRGTRNGHSTGVELGLKGVTHA